MYNQYHQDEEEIHLQLSATRALCDHELDCVVPRLPQPEAVIEIKTKGIGAAGAVCNQTAVVVRTEITLYDIQGEYYIPPYHTPIPHTTLPISTAVAGSGEAILHDMSCYYEFYHGTPYYYYYIPTTPRSTVANIYLFGMCVSFLFLFVCQKIYVLFLFVNLLLIHKLKEQSREYSIVVLVLFL